MKLPKLIQHIGYSLAYLPSEIIFKLLCSLKVEGKENIEFHKNVLLISNHKTLIDNWVITCATFGIRVVTNWNLTPYNPAAVENFLETPVKRLIFGDFLKCIPVDRQKFDINVLESMVEKLKSGTMITFPEGTRTRATTMRTEAKTGVGYVIYKARPVVIPVYHTGTEKVLPIGSSMISIGHKIRVKIGKPISFDSFYKMPDDKQTWQMTANHALESLIDLEKECLT